MINKVAKILSIINKRLYRTSEKLFLMMMLFFDFNIIVHNAQLRYIYGQMGSNVHQPRTAVHHFPKLINNLLINQYVIINKKDLY